MTLDCMRLKFRPPLQNKSAIPHHSPIPLSHSNWETMISIPCYMQSALCAPPSKPNPYSSSTTSAPRQHPRRRRFAAQWRDLDWADFQAGRSKTALRTSALRPHPGGERGHQRCCIAFRPVVEHVHNERRRGMERLQLMVQRTQRRASFRSNSSCCSRSGEAMNPNRV